VQQLGDEQPFPEFATDKIPVEKRMLEDKSEREDEFPVKDCVVVTENARECNHEECRSHGGKQTQLENVPEKRSDGGSAPEKGEDKRRHAEIGNGAENRVVGLEEAKVPVGGGPEVTRNEILYKKGNSLDEEIYKRNENTDFNVAESLEHGGKDRT
jgi:hypothetical protein